MQRTHGFRCATATRFKRYKATLPRFRKSTRIAKTLSSAEALKQSRTTLPRENPSNSKPHGNTGNTQFTSGQYLRCRGKQYRIRPTAFNIKREEVGRAYRRLAQWFPGDHPEASGRKICEIKTYFHAHRTATHLPAVTYSPHKQAQSHCSEYHQCYYRLHSFNCHPRLSISVLNTGQEVGWK